MITTLPFAPTKADLFKIFVIRYFKKRAGLFLLVIILIGLSSVFSDDKNSSPIVPILVFVTVFPLLICLSFWRYVSSRDNKALFLNRYYEMDFDNIKTFLDDGSMSSIKLSNFIKSEFIAGSYLMYVTKAEYLMIPNSSFKSPEDLHWFKINILGKIETPGLL